MIHIIIKASSEYPIDRKRIRKKVVDRLKKYSLKDQVEVGINFTGDRKIARLNKAYLKKTGPTDVLSFPLAELDKIDKKKTGFIEPPDEVLHLGDIVISYPQVRHQAQKENLLVDEVIDRLVQHGLLHLLGVHHDY